MRGTCRRCERPVHGRGLCSVHYNRLARRKVVKQSTARLPLDPLRLALLSRGETIKSGLSVNHQRAVYRSPAGLTLWMADEIAVAMGMHPQQIWSDWYELTAPSEEREQVAV